ncbi:MAG: polysaccharide deacetylase family protein [Bacteroidota bacterium]|nr:polysaccharide deacetylase family protein [Bacteroidota bacterium]
MPSKKQYFFKACSWLPFTPLAALNKQHSLFVPIYHAITEERLIHLEHILPYGSKNSRQFEQDMDLLLKNLKPISYDDLLACYRENKPVPPKSFIITFDDGLRQTYENAPEIMLRKGIPAIFYLNTAVIDNKALLHRYKASILLEYIKLQNSESLIKKVQEILIENNIIQPDYYKGIKSINYKNRQVYDIIAHAIEYSFEAYLKQHKPYMNTTQVQDLKNKGFILGSHSEWHPEYWNIDTDEQVHQTESAMQYLKEHFNETHRTFSFPFTDIKTPMRFFNELKKTAPFELLFGSQKLKKDMVPNMVHRFDGDNNLSDMQTYLKALLVFQTINKIRGRSIVQRKLS